MAVAAVDTSVLVGIADSQDQYHDVASEIVGGIDHGTLNWIHDRRRHGKAVETYTRLNESAGFEVIHTPQKDFHRAVELDAVESVTRLATAENPFE